MSARRVLLCLAAALAVFAASSAFAQEAKAPVYHVYKKCSSNFVCTGAAYFNKKQTRTVNVQVGKTCSDKSAVSIAFSGSAKVSSAGKFKVTQPTSSWDYTNKVSVVGTGTIDGTLKKGKKVTLKYSVDKVPAACSAFASGKVTASYKGTQSGG